MSKSSESILRISKDLLLDRNVRVIAITSLISGVYIGMLNTVLQPFTLSLGLGLTALGILQALGNRFSGITASLIQPFTGHYADVFGRKVVIVVGSAATIVSMILFFIAALTRSWVVLTMAYVLYGISMLSSPASQAVVAESVSLEPAKMDVAFSAVFLFGSIPGAVMSFVAGVLADSVGYFVVFIIAVILESVDLFLYMRELRETKALTKLAESPAGQDRFSFRSAVSLPKGFLGFFATFAMDSFAFGISVTIIYGMLVERFRYSNTDIGLIVGTLAIATILAQYPATKLLLRVGPKKSLVLSELFGGVLMLGWWLSNSIALFVLLSVVFGISIATWVPAQQSMLMAHSPSRERASLGGKLAAFRGLFSFPAPIVGGLLYQTFGYYAPLLASTAGIILTLVMIVRLLPDGPR
jgi:DHA1 family multidrug resistance protein-like MFS transporter